MSPRTSDLLKVEYLTIQKEIEAVGPSLDPSVFGPNNWFYQVPGVIRADLLLRREPERSRRVLRLLFANWLASCDLPPEDRPPIVWEGTADLYEALPMPTAPLTPRALDDWLRSTRLAYTLLPAISSGVRSLDRDRSTFASLEVTLAEQLYLREHGKPPATLGDLLGPDLPRLPAGYEPGDPSSLAPNP